MPQSRRSLPLPLPQPQSTSLPVRGLNGANAPQLQSPVPTLRILCNVLLANRRVWSSTSQLALSLPATTAQPTAVSQAASAAAKANQAGQSHRSHYQPVSQPSIRPTNQGIQAASQLSSSIQLGSATQPGSKAACAVATLRESNHNYAERICQA